MKSLKKVFLNLSGIAYIVLGMIAFYNALAYTETANFLWFSYFSFFIIGIGLLTRKSWLIASQLCILLIPYIVWNIDFFYVLITNSGLWGITDYFFTPRKTLAQLISLQHIFTIPISLIAIYFIKLKRNDFWKFSLAQVMVFFILVRIFTAPTDNVNCVFENCLSFAISSKIYPIFWFLAYGAMIALITFMLKKIKVFWNNPPKTL